MSVRRVVVRGWWLPVALLLASIAVAQEAGDLVSRGERVFMLQGCYGCHVVGRYGTPIGPNLSFIGQRYSVADATRWLRDPSQQRPTAHMPRLELSAEEVAALAAFLAAQR